jgi:hypothetical protein
MQAFRTTGRFTQVRAKLLKLEPAQESGGRGCRWSGCWASGMRLCENQDKRRPVLAFDSLR